MDPELLYRILRREVTEDDADALYTLFCDHLNGTPIPTGKTCKRILRHRAVYEMATYLLRKYPNESNKQIGYSIAEYAANPFLDELRSHPEMHQHIKDYLLCGDPLSISHLEKLVASIRTSSPADCA